MAGSKKSKGTATSSKIKIASQSLNDKVTKLLELAAGAPKQTLSNAKSASKLFELVVLADLLDHYSAHYGPGCIRIKNVVKNTLNLAGGPAKADRHTFSYFELLDAPRGTVQQEVWISVQVTTVSWSLSGAKSVPVLPSGKHEIDVAIFCPKISGYPAHTELLAGFSCKHFKPQKESVREALGLRRETAYLRDDQPSAVPWLLPTVPADPPSPIYLVSSAAGVSMYRHHVDRVGVYVHCVPFVS